MILHYNHSWRNGQPAELHGQLTAHLWKDLGAGVYCRERVHPIHSWKNLQNIHAKTTGTCIKESKPVGRRMNKKPATVFSFCGDASLSFARLRRHLGDVHQGIDEEEKKPPFGNGGFS